MQVKQVDLVSILRSCLQGLFVFTHIVQDVKRKKNSTYSDTFVPGQVKDIHYFSPLEPEEQAKTQNVSK